MNVSDFDYELPESAIAQAPVEPRDASRLLVLHRGRGTLEHRTFRDLPEYLRPGDVLVINDSRVIPARLFGEKEGTGGSVELLLLERRGLDPWEALVRPGRRVRPGARLVFGGGLLRAEVKDVTPAGGRIVSFFYEGVFEDLLRRLGEMPLPLHQERLDDPELPDGHAGRRAPGRLRRACTSPRLLEHPQPGDRHRPLTLRGPRHVRPVSTRP